MLIPLNSDICSAGRFHIFISASVRGLAQPAASVARRQPREAGAASGAAPPEGTPVRASVKHVLSQELQLNLGKILERVWWRWITFECGLDRITVISSFSSLPRVLLSGVCHACSDRAASYQSEHFLIFVCLGNFPSLCANDRNGVFALSGT